MNNLDRARVRIVRLAACPSAAARPAGGGLLGPLQLDHGSRSTRPRAWARSCTGSRARRARARTAARAARARRQRRSRATASPTRAARRRARSCRPRRRGRAARGGTPGVSITPRPSCRARRPPGSSSPGCTGSSSVRGRRRASRDAARRARAVPAHEQVDVAHVVGLEHDDDARPQCLEPVRPRARRAAGRADRAAARRRATRPRTTPPRLPVHALAPGGMRLAPQPQAVGDIADLDRHAAQPIRPAARVSPPPSPCAPPRA